MINLFVALPDEGKDPQKASWFNLNIGGIWQYGKFSVVTTFYLGIFMALILGTVFLAIFGGNQTFIRPEDVRLIWKVMIWFLPFVILFESFLAFYLSYNSKKEAAATREAVALKAAENSKTRKRKR